MDLENLPPQISEILIKIAPALERISRKGISPESDKSQWQAAILSALMGDRFAQVDQEISGAVGFKIDSKDVSIFSKFTHWISAQNPQFLREWKNTDRRRYERFTNSVSNTSTGLTA